MFNDFVLNDSNKFINLANETNSTIDALILVFDTKIQSMQKYSKPKLISRMLTDHSDTVKKYAFNLNNQTNRNDYAAKVQHKFIQRCYLLDGLIPVYFTCSVILFCIALCWILLVFFVRKKSEQSFAV